MAIAQLVNTFSGGGAESVAYKIAKSLVGKCGSHIISISSFNDIVEKRVTGELNALGVRTYNIGRKPHREFIKGVLECRRYFKENKLQIVHTHCESPDVVGRLASLGLDVKVISTLHNHRPYPRRRLLGWAVERCLNFKTAKLVECSPHMEQAWRYLGYSPDKVVCIRNGIDPERFRLSAVQSKRKWLEALKLPGNARLVVSVGRIANAKGHDVLVRSFYSVRKKYPNVFLIIAGTHDTEPQFYRYVESLVASMELSDSVLMIGETDDVPSLMAAADLIVMPSRWEGLSLAFLEALAAGRPLVSTRIVPHVEILPPEMQGNLVAPDSVEELSQKLDEVLKDKEAQEARGVLGKRLVEDNYNERQMVDHYVRIYEEVLRN